MIVITISDWRKKLIIMLCFILLLSVMVATVNHYQMEKVEGEIEFFDDVITDGKLQSAEDNLEQNKGILEEDAEIKKGFFQQMLERFRN